MVGTDNLVEADRLIEYFNTLSMIAALMCGVSATFFGSIETLPEKAPRYSPLHRPSCHCLGAWLAHSLTHLYRANFALVAHAHWLIDGRCALVAEICFCTSQIGFAVSVIEASLASNSLQVPVHWLRARQMCGRQLTLSEYALHHWQLVP